MEDNSSSRVDRSTCEYEKSRWKTARSELRVAAGRSSRCFFLPLCACRFSLAPSLALPRRTSHCSL